PGEFVMDVGADDTLTVSNAIVTNSAGGAGLTKEGDGELIIQANSSYTGITTVNGGTLEILATAGGNTPGTDSYQINNGSTLFLNETTASNLVLAVGRGDITFGSSLTGGTLSLNGNTIFRNQTITTTGGAKNFVSGDRLNLQNSRSIAFDTAVGTDGIDLEVSATISSGDIIKNGAGTVSLTNSANNLGLQGGATGDPNTVTINAGTLEIGGAGRLVLGNYAGAITNDGTFKYNSTNAQTLSGVISGNGAVVKDNSSTLTLSGDNTYSGDTTVSAGTLALSHASLNNIISNSTVIDVAGGATLDVSALGGGSGGLELANGQTISGSGTVSGDMTIGSGSVLSPGNSPGTMTVDNLTWTDGGTYLWEINNLNGGQGVDSGWDFISITNTFDLSGITTNFDIDITSLTLGNAPGFADGFSWAGLEYGDSFGTTFIIATANSITGFEAGDFLLDDSGFVNGKLEWSISLDDGVTDSLVLSAVFVPEPSSTALLGLGGLALMLRRKRS
ncbi:MAG: PEP-CTERM sorting domain-containing protein, partial [Verrucomicrobiaceae bacterium]|nr:PEP-CTERM sorting domain-containing protein [Verrucomicrobiaceae bacterium]